MAITKYIRNVDGAIPNTVIENTVRRVNKCLKTGGENFEQNKLCHQVLLQISVHTTCLIRSYVHQLNLTFQQEEDCVSTESKVKGGFHYLALEIMNTRYPEDKWLHIFTDGSQLEGYIKAAAGIDCELFSCYIPLGEHSKPYVLHYVC